MKIGITVDIRHSMFSAGHPNSCVAIAEAFQIGGHEIIFVKRETEKNWWDDVNELESAKVYDINTVFELDLLIEVGFLLNPIERSRYNKCVWYCRKPAIFTDIEATVFSCKIEGRDLQGVSEIWVADIYNNNDDIVYLKNLYSFALVKVVPWLWSPTIVETHRKKMQSPVWKQVRDLIPSDTKWSLHVTESNFSNTSSCTIPIVVLKDTKLKDTIEKIHVHNADHLSESRYFKTNILENCMVENIKLVGRQRIIDWCHEPMSIILAHSRFIDLKLANLEAAWVGLPLIHNNSILRDFGCGLEQMFYENNNIGDALEALKKTLASHSSIPYLSNIDSLTELRKKILYRFSPEARAKEWLALLTSSAGPEKVIKPIVNKTIKVERVYRILFTDMWDQFSPATNMFTLAFKDAMPGVEVLGYSTETLQKGIKHDIHIFGPFGERWKKIEGPKVHFTGENTDPILEASVKLNIGFKYIDSASYFRLPLWMLEIDWFQADNLEEINNPLPLPLEACITAVSSGIRSKFCAFVVSNPKNEIRNDAFKVLNEYKPVDSAGRLFNNVGNKIFAGLGGGGGELKKYEFLKDYKFCLCYENESSDGYVTEKLLHAKAAGCIPIYWGDPLISRDFNKEGFINLTGSPETLVQRVREIDESDELYNKMRSIPAINPASASALKHKFTEIVDRILSGYVLATFATEKFWPSLIRWIDATEIHMKSIQDIKVRVYVGDDVKDHIIEKTRGKYPFVKFIRVPTETPNNFSDFWKPEHYAWKLWIYKDLSEDPTLKGNLTLYSDCASVLIRWPTEWLNEAVENKICFLEDASNKNKTWCHSTFCSTLKVNDEEKESLQISGGIVAFISGDLTVKKLFKDAYDLGCIRNVIVGEKWLLENGKIENGKLIHDGKLPIGHRHDQSILSILSLRYKCKRYPFDNIVNNDSARSTYFSGKFIYLHRGDYKTHIQIMQGIDEAYVINLDRRVDRRTSFIEHHPYFKGAVKRHMACDGLSLTLTPSLVSLFRPNDFFWKKAVMGCAISHLKLWTMLQGDSEEIQSYLILEDDARLKPGWKDAWLKVYPNLPAGWECIYLGGILPPNKQGFELVREPVIPGLCRIKPNTFFGQSEPMRHFHFCAYAYILSRDGCKKILNEIVKHKGIWTSADHVLFNSLDKMNVYCLDPLVAGALQDDDPAYVNSDFNDFSRKDKFDSDLWNNNERFSIDEVSACLNLPLQIIEPLQEVYQPILRKAPPRFISLDICNLSHSRLYEGKWFQELFGKTNFTLESVSAGMVFEEYENLVVLLLRPLWADQLAWITELAKTNTFKVIHCSDEDFSDPSEFYKWPSIKGVMRIYPKNEQYYKILNIPLGYHWQNTFDNKALDDRQLSWSFVGTDWRNRSKNLEPLLAIENHSVKYFSGWNDANQLKDKDYISLLQNTKFIPCPEGNNVETYRFYEALECGCIPVFTKIPPILLDSKIPFLKTDTWEQVSELMKYFLKNPEQMNQYRDTILSGWHIYKSKLKVSVEKWLLL